MMVKVKHLSEGDRLNLQRYRLTVFENIFHHHSCVNHHDSRGFSHHSQLFGRTFSVAKVYQPLFNETVFGLFRQLGLLCSFSVLCRGICPDETRASRHLC
jgi:hypothetical protein